MPLMDGYLPVVGGKYPLVQCKNSANSVIHPNWWENNTTFFAVHRMETKSNNSGWGNNKKK